MNLFKLSVSDLATERELETSASVGPFVVAALDEQWARAIVSINFSLAVYRRHFGEPTPVMIWGESGASECRTLDAVNPEVIQQRRIVGGVDTATAHLCKPQLIYEGKETARMLWWPCDPGDICPV